ncbi:MAG: hypothetical protein KGV57_01350 [Fusobacterium sp.]|nr:hypothetical protein [Fusobacterium sp.]
MIVKFSKEFVKKSKKISPQDLASIRNVILEVKGASSVEELKQCKKLVGYKNSYRIRVRDLRLFFTLMIYVEDNEVVFQYLLNRGEAYSKKYLQKMKNRDNE